MKNKTLMAIALLFCAMVSIASINSNVLADDSKAKQLPESTWKTFVAIRDTAIREQIYAPVRQQFTISMARVIYVLSDQTEPEDLIHRASNLRDDAMTREFLDEVWVDAKMTLGKEPAVAEKAIFDSMLSMTSGSARYISAKESRVQKQLSENQYVGIGIQLQFQDPYTKIALPFPRGTAWEAGIKKNDLILEVDGESMHGWPLRKVVEKLRGPKGSTVQVKVRNENSKEERDYEITRRVIPLDTVVGTRLLDDGSWDHMVGDDESIAYVRFDSIVGSSAAEFKTLANRLEQQGRKAFILDFRRVIDADVHHLSLLADVLLTQGEFGAIESKTRTSTLRTRNDHTLSDVPLVVLTRHRVPGPLFLLCEKLQSSGRATIIGPVTQSEMICTRQVELPDQLGAISQLPYAICRSTRNPLTSQSQHELIDKALNLSRPAVIAPEIRETRPDQVIQKSIEHLKAKLNRR